MGTVNVTNKNTDDPSSIDTGEGSHQKKTIDNMEESNDELIESLIKTQPLCLSCC